VSWMECGGEWRWIQIVLDVAVRDEGDGDIESNCSKESVGMIEAPQDMLSSRGIRAVASGQVCLAHAWSQSSGVKLAPS
jgi:hypothetical protein